MAAGLLFTMVFFVSGFRVFATGQYANTKRQIIMFSDLECDYINPFDLCNKLNQVRIRLSGPLYVIQFSINAIYFLAI